MSRIKEGFKLCAVDNEFVVVAQGIEHVDYSRVMTLNETGAWLWQELIDQDFTSEDIVSLLLENYEVEESVARQDSIAFIDGMKEAGII